MSDELTDQLAASQELVATMLRIAAEDPSARVGAWTLSDVAAHLETTERECFEPRIRAIASGERPLFDFYSNDDRDFSGVALDRALDDWFDSRTRLLEFVRGLTDEERGRVGVHQTYGEISVDRYLELALEHDREHLSGLEKVAGELAR